MRDKTTKYRENQFIKNVGLPFRSNIKLFFSLPILKAWALNHQCSRFLIYLLFSYSFFNQLRMDKMHIDMMDERYDPGKDKADIEVDTSGNDHRGIEQNDVADDHLEHIVKDRLTRADSAGQRDTIRSEPTKRLQRVDIDDIDLYSRELGDIVQSDVEHQYTDGDIGKALDKVQHK